jgi:flagellar protein FlaJ
MKIFKAKQASKKKEKWSLRETTLVSFSGGGALLLMNYILFSSFEQVYAIVNLLAAVIILGIPLIFKYNDYKEVKNTEVMFPKYLRDVAENISTGMTLPQAMRTASAGDYGTFSRYAKEMSAKISWGIPLEKALIEFAKKSRSKAMMRNVQTIIEAYRSGGTIDTILKSVAQSLQELEKIKKERSSSVYAQMINGYLIYVIFLGVMIGLATILVPAFTKFGGGGQELQQAFVEIFRALTIIQGFFAGIAIGKMAEGTIVAGLKHALALVIFGYSALLMFT